MPDTLTFAVQPSEHEEVVPQLNRLSSMFAPPSSTILPLIFAAVSDTFVASLVSTVGGRVGVLPKKSKTASRNASTHLSFPTALFIRLNSC